MRRFLAKPLPRRTKKSKKTDKCIVSGYRPKAGVVDQGTTNLVCRRHEFGMGHLRDPAACYLDSTLSEYRRLRPRQKRFLFFLRFSSQDFPVKRDVEKQTFQTRCRTTSSTLTTSGLQRNSVLLPAPSPALPAAMADTTSMRGHLATARATQLVDIVR